MYEIQDFFFFFFFFVPEQNARCRGIDVGSLVNRFIEHKLCAPLELVSMVSRSSLHRVDHRLRYYR